MNLVVPDDASNQDRLLAYMHERELVRLRRESGWSWPWTSDHILQKFRFTNVQRRYDKTTQAFCEIYRAHDNAPWHQIILNCGVYRFFGTAEFAQRLGWLEDFDPDYIIGKAREARNEGDKVFTGAYVITNSGIIGPKEEVITQNFLTDYAAQIHHLAKVAESQSWKQVCMAMREINGFGGTGFMSKEICQDLILTPVLRNATDRRTWCPAGPGARQGLNFILGGDKFSKTSSEEDCIAAMADLLVHYDANKKYFMPDLDLHDIQFNLCEFAKYEKGRLGLRVKRKYAVADSDRAKGLFV